MLSKMKTPIITTSDIGNGNTIEITMLIPKDNPIHISWLRRNCPASVSQGTINHASSIGFVMIIKYECGAGNIY